MTPPRPCEYRRSVVIAASVDSVFAFHADPANIPKISPGWQSVQVRQGGTAATGDEFEIEVRFLRVVSMRWHGVWHEVSRPGLLVDDALQSPFAYWRHRHMFEPLGARRTRMTDHVSYAFPGGWLGKLFGETIGRCQFALMFADRHARVRRVLE